MTAYPMRPYGASYGRDHLPDYGRPDGRTVDCHGHMAVPAADELVRPHLPAAALDAVKYASPEARAVNQQQNTDRMPFMIGTEQRLKDMDRMGLDMQVMSPVPPQFNYQADAGLCAEASQIINDGLAGTAATSDRLVAIGTVPLQDCDRAITEMERCMGELGMPGLELGANAGADEISAERLEPFWARAEELGATILLHPTSFASDRLGKFYLSNVIGNPLETTVAVAHLIFDGVLERYPDLKIILSHGGAYAAAYTARMDHAWGARPDCRGRISRPPSTFMDQIYLDTIVFATDQLDYLHRKFGANRLLIGTDYAFDMGEYDPIEHVQQTPGIDAEGAEKICGGNAVDLFNLDPAKCGRADFMRGTADV